MTMTTAPQQQLATLVPRSDVVRRVPAIESAWQKAGAAWANRRTYVPRRNISSKPTPVSDLWTAVGTAWGEDVEATPVLVEPAKKVEAPAPIDVVW